MVCDFSVLIVHQQSHAAVTAATNGARWSKWATLLVYLLLLLLLLLELELETFKDDIPGKVFVI